MITNKVVMELSDKFIEDLRKLGYSSTGAYILNTNTREHPYEFGNISHAGPDGNLIGCLSIDWVDFKYLFTDDTQLNIYALASKENAENIPFLKVMRSEGVKFYNLKVLKPEAYVQAEKDHLLLQNLDNQFLMILPLRRLNEKEFAF